MTLISDIPYNYLALIIDQLTYMQTYYYRSEIFISTIFWKKKPKKLRFLKNSKSTTTAKYWYRPKYWRPHYADTILNWDPHQCSAVPSFLFGPLFHFWNKILGRIEIKYEFQKQVWFLTEDVNSKKNEKMKSWTKKMMGLQYIGADSILGPYRHSADSNIWVCTGVLLS